MSAAPGIVAPLPGWYGKLPGMGDFAHRRLPAPFRQAWDEWLQHGLHHLRLQHEDWLEHYLQGPVWLFVLGPEVVGDTAWIGVLMPSVDGVGRYFPFTIARELDVSTDAAGDLQGWWQRAATAALEGLENDLDAERFEAALQRQFDAAGAGVEAAPPALPPSGQSLWLTDASSAQGLRLRTAGLPRDGRFDALFGFAEAESPVEGGV